jgi:serine protease AprX
MSTAPFLSRRFRRAAWLGAAALLVPGVALTASASPHGQDVAQLQTVLPAVSDVSQRTQPWLAGELQRAGASETLRVMVSGETTAAAEAAARAAGLTVQQTWDQVGIVVGVGLPDQVRAVAGQPGVRYVEGDQPLAYALSTAHQATRSDEALAAVASPTGTRVDGSGVTIAVIDSGIDSSHPMFKRGSEPSKVVRNLKNVCGISVSDSTNETCFQPVSDSDSVSAGGHGTHVAGIAAGYEVTTSSPAGTRLRGAAPGASCRPVGGASTGLIDAARRCTGCSSTRTGRAGPRTSRTARRSRSARRSGSPTTLRPATENDQSTVFDERSAEVSLQRP